MASIGCVITGGISNIASLRMTWVWFVMSDPLQNRADTKLDPRAKQFR